MTAAGNLTPDGRQRLDSWKEIAAFFGRDERTVNRWEKELRLPVHRLPGRAKGPVYAYTDELAAWMTTPRQEGMPLPDPSLADPSLADLGLVDSGPAERPAGLIAAQADAGSLQLGPVLLHAAVKPNTPAREMGLGQIARDGTTKSWFAAGGILVVAFVLAWVLLHESSASHSQTKSTAGHSASAGIVQASTPPHNPEAEQLYLQGRYYWTKRTPGDLNKAVDYFTQAIVKDPSYSNAYVGLADCYNLLREYTLMPAAEAYPRALAAAQKAVELDGQSSEAHASVAFASFWGKWDFVTADREFQRAIELDSGNAVAYHWYATYLGMVRRFPEALTEIDRAQALDPSSTAILADKGDLLLVAGRLDESLVLLKKMEVTEPRFVSSPRYLKLVDYAKGDYAGYLAEWRKEALLMHDPSSLALVTEAGKGFSAGGVKGMLESTLRLQKRQYARQQAAPFQLARTCSLLGNRQEAIQYLEISYEQHDASLLAVEADPAFDSLRDEAAYRELMARMNFPRN